MLLLVPLVDGIHEGQPQGSADPNVTWHKNQQSHPNCASRLKAEQNKICKISRTTENRGQWSIF
jgi:hypothetical protein